MAEQSDSMRTDHDGGRHHPDVPARRVLRRAHDERVIAGVCGGIARYIDVDPTLVRILFAVLAIGEGSGVLLYLLAWLLIAEERPGDPVGRLHHTDHRVLALGAGTTLVVLGLFGVVRLLVPWLDVQFVWPVALIAAGLALLARARTHR